MLYIIRDTLIKDTVYRRKDYLLGFFIHLLSYAIALTAKRGGIIFQKNDLILLILILTISFIYTVLLEKYSNNEAEISIYSFLKTYFYSFLLSLGTISFLITLFFKEEPSRYIVFGAMVISFAMEAALLIVRKDFKHEIKMHHKFNFSIYNFLTELLMFVAVSYIIASLLSKKIPSIPTYPFVYISYFFAWLISSTLIHNFNSILGASRFWVFIWGRIKTYTIFISVVSLLLYAFNCESHLREGLIILAASYSLFAVLFFSSIYAFNRQPKTDEIKASYRSIIEYKENINLSIHELENPGISPVAGNNDAYLYEQLADVYLKKYPEVFDFISQSLNLNSFDLRRCVVIRSADAYNVEILPENYIAFYLNLHEINDIGRINEYFLKINQRLLNNGFYIGRVEPTHLRFQRFLLKYPYHLARAFYFADFIWKRALPNLPFLRKIYFAFTNGKKRAISFPEALGRLYYCGFEVVNYRQVENFIYFICKKTNQPDQVGNPLYGPLIKLKRIGRHGKAINIYKLRTMHPYSEYIQKFIFESHHLDSEGKIKNDFRITSWGKVFRKLWIDELPMLINLFRGNLKIVGVRPLSPHYFTLYDEDLKKLRIKYKPGIFPPFYYDIPKTFTEIMDSERRYLLAYKRHPVLTDIKYFFVILYNIVIKKARSH